MPKLSLVIPVKDEEKNIAPLMTAVRSSLAGIDYELLIVDDGSVDNTCGLVQENGDHRTVLVKLEKNFGQSAAMRAGIEQSTGSFIAMMDGDLQNDPADIPLMLSTLKEGGWDMVAGNRKNRKDGFFLRKIPSFIANMLIRNLTGVHLKDYGCSLRIFKRHFAMGLGLHEQYHRFIPVLTYLQGARMTQVDVKHHPRKHGNSKYGLSRTFKVIRDLSVMTYLTPKHKENVKLFGLKSLIMFAVALASGIFILWNIFLKSHGWPLMIVPIFLFGTGVFLFFIGQYGRRKARKFIEEQGKMPYRIEGIFRHG